MHFSVLDLLRLTLPPSPVKQATLLHMTTLSQIRDSSVVEWR